MTELKLRDLDPSSIRSHWQPTGRIQMLLHDDLSRGMLEIALDMVVMGLHMTIAMARCGSNG
jgi:hypothetical protein